MPIDNTPTLVVRYFGCKYILRFPVAAGPELVAWAHGELRYLVTIMDHRPEFRRLVRALEPYQ